MPKMRGIKPETWTDDKVIDLSPLARLLFIGMWNYACDNGHVENKPKQLKLRILPADDCNVSALIDEMLEVGCVIDQGDHLTVPNLPLHQRIDKRYFTACEHCAPDEIPEGHVVRTAGTQRAHAGHTAGARVEGRKEGSEGSEGESESASADKSASTMPRKKPATRLPEDWRPNEAHWERRHDSLDIEREAKKFRAHAEANDRRQVNWNAAFTQWLLNARPEPRGTVHRLPGGEDPNAWMRRTL